ncbi:zinc finger BED domain-containing protein 4-like [Hypomesus transpacificus]|uniref:zinc finger BED domain-containing protein 4-like n=1 Tax=Hypomesus transpacificus TaxID=137520 RepID=UPI001F076085|nr:zinc finger BED domain-containing protein 4-like [Hypomesus transpacificus]XP_046895359.1 zinc finger BED domain-containing protein 4-like [Hypomesus transpacificus]
MLQSLIEQKRAIAAYGVDHELPASLTLNQWALMENMVTLLEPFEQLTRDMCSATATTAEVIPSVQALKRLLRKETSSDHGVKSSKQTLLEEVNRRFNDLSSEPLYCFSAILDPRYKDRYFDPGVKVSAVEILRQKVEQNVQCRENLDDGNYETPEKLPRRERSSLMEMYDEIVNENDCMTQEQEGSPLQGYLAECLLSRDKSPLEY